MGKKLAKKTALSSVEANRPPVVAVLGHVDHGKTTLLDTIRQTSLASREHGGITQHIGAYSVQVPTKEGQKAITFIDTPGHQAFAKMRSRGAAVADIAILVVSAVDGVMPQTIEAIGHIQTAKIPLIVAINKIDLPEANVERIKQQLAKADVLVEGYGGDIVAIPISAKVGTGIAELLEMIIFLAEMKGLPMEKEKAVSAVVIESKQDRRRGPVASVVVKTGTILIGSQLMAETVTGRVRAMVDSGGKNVVAAYPSDAVEILGFVTPPPVGAVVVPVGETTIPEKEEEELKQSDEQPMEMAIKIVVKADTLGTLDAIKTTLPSDVHVVLAGVGDVNESDVLFAKTAGAIIVGFGVTVLPSAKKLAIFERVMIKTYDIIYKLAEEISDVVKAIREGRLEETLGSAQIIAEFPFNNDKIAGVKVKEGRLAKGDQVKILREKEEVGRTKIASIRLLKQEVNKVEAGKECGLRLIPQLDFKAGDDIISYR